MNQATNQVLQESMESNFTKYENLTSMAKLYSSKREGNEKMLYVT